LADVNNNAIPGQARNDGPGCVPLDQARNDAPN
jgi:hypothetical protein